MKSFSLEELKSLIPLFQKYTGAQVQNILSSKEGVCIVLYLNKKIYFHFYMKASSPLIFLRETPPKIVKKTTPTALFLKKYLSDYIFSKLELGSGRVLFFYFSKIGCEDVLVEARLFPHGQNVIGTCGNKKISWFKPKEIIASDYKERGVAIDAQELMAKKIKEFDLLGQTKSAINKKNIDELIEKLEKIKVDESRIKEYHEDILLVSEKMNVDSIRNKYKIKDNAEWYEVLDLLKAKLEKEKNKKQRILERIVDLKKQNEFAKNRKVDTLKEVRASKYKLLSDGKRALLGKNAKENITLLRKAKAWYLWLHLRDLPSAHIIIEKNKNQLVSDQEVIEVAKWLLENSKKVKTLQDGDKYEVQFTECRYVKPIKGDKLGRVTVQRERVLSFTYKSH